METETKQKAPFALHGRTKFYRPHSIRLTYGSVFDCKNNLVDLKERQLDGTCGENENGVITGDKHQWLLLPQQEGQKEYVLCMNCGERSHL